jgi:hypothetical protein
MFLIKIIKTKTWICCFLLLHWIQNCSFWKFVRHWVRCTVDTTLYTTVSHFYNIILEPIRTIHHNLDRTTVQKSVSKIELWHIRNTVVYRPTSNIVFLSLYWIQKQQCWRFKPAVPWYSIQLHLYWLSWTLGYKPSEFVLLKMLNLFSKVILI